MAASHRQASHLIKPTSLFCRSNRPLEANHYHPPSIASGSDDLAREWRSVSHKEGDIMMRVSVIVGAFVVALGLAPISAQAQQISACVNNSSGGIKIVAPNATCSNNETKLVWPAGPGGLTAGADYHCVGGGGDANTLERHVPDPQSIVVGTSMSAPPLRDEQERSDLVAYLALS
jgi:hypothetical protein